MDVLVANDDIGLGQTVAAENLQWQTWTKSSSSGSFIRKKDRPEAITQIVGSIAQPVHRGATISEQKLVGERFRVHGSDPARECGPFD